MALRPRDQFLCGAALIATMWTGTYFAVKNAFSGLHESFEDMNVAADNMLDSTSAMNTAVDDMARSMDENFLEIETLLNAALAPPLPLCNNNFRFWAFAPERCETITAPGQNILVEEFSASAHLIQRIIDLQTGEAASQFDDKPPSPAEQEIFERYLYDSHMG